jgi:hypothetical protein
MGMCYRKKHPLWCRRDGVAKQRGMESELLRLVSTPRDTTACSSGPGDRPEHHQSSVVASRFTIGTRCLTPDRIAAGDLEIAVDFD